jgi:D-glycero-D-manno-heptose 1,7-bisphosphate phosphatase
MNLMWEKKLVILDRDGVINYESPHYIKSPAEWIPLPGSLQAIAQLTAQGIRVAVATNQSGLARGLFDEVQLQAIHQTLMTAVEDAGGRIDKIVYCPHHPEYHCECRKPKTGLLEQIRDYFAMDLTGVPFIGDSEKDVLAAQAMQCYPMLVRTGYGENSIGKLPADSTVPIYENLQAAVTALLRQE